MKCSSIGFLLWFMTSLVQAQELALSIDQVLSIFYKRNLDVISAQYNIERSRAQEIIAAAIPNPVFTSDFQEIAPRNNDKLGPYWGFAISQLIQTAGKRSLRMESSYFGTKAVEEDLQNAIRILSNSVRKSYYTLLLLQKNAEVLLENIAQYEELIRINRLRLQQGDIAESDFLRINVEQLKVESDWNNANAAIGAARSDLANLLAWPENASQLKAQDPWPDVKLLSEDTTEESLVQKAIQLRPDISAAEARIAQADKQLLLAKSLVIPDVTATLAYNHDPQNTQSNFAGVTLSVPIPIFYRQQGEIGQARVDLSSSRLDLNKIKQKLRTEIVSILAKLNAAIQTTKRFESKIINKIDQIRNAAELSYNKGKTSIIDLIEAERSHKAVMLDYYTALNNRTQYYVDLQMAVGEE